MEYTHEQFREEFSQRIQARSWPWVVSAKSVRISAVEHPAGNILPPDVAIPYLSLCGVWLERLGLKAGHRVTVEGAPGRVTLTLDETPVELPYRYRKHTPKKTRARQLNQQQ